MPEATKTLPSALSSRGLAGGSQAGGFVIFTRQRWHVPFPLQAVETTTPSLSKVLRREESSRHFISFPSTVTVNAGFWFKVAPNMKRVWYWYHLSHTVCHETYIISHTYAIYQCQERDDQRCQNADSPTIWPPGHDSFPIISDT